MNWQVGYGSETDHLWSATLMREIHKTVPVSPMIIRLRTVNLNISKYLIIFIGYLHAFLKYFLEEFFGLYKSMYRVGTDHQNFEELNGHALQCSRLEIGTLIFASWPLFEVDLALPFSVPAKMMFFTDVAPDSEHWFLAQWHLKMTPRTVYCAKALFDDGVNFRLFNWKDLIEKKLASGSLPRSSFWQNTCAPF